MKFQMINHASFLWEHDSIKLLTDPWLTGTAFDNGWGLLAKTCFTSEDFAEITHIWFSHEHPDHFHPQSLRTIPEEYRKRITILYQQSTDKKVIDWCRAFGFQQVIELSPDKWYSLSDDISVLCRPFPVGDSWLCIKTADMTILNLNDCEVSTTQEAKDILNRVGDIDLVWTQFSYAGWAGNKEDFLLRKKRAMEKLARVKKQLEVLQPLYVIPFASFAWFCHDENYYMNDAINKVDSVYRLLREETDAEPIILYPGDTWTPHEAHDPAKALALYARDYEKMASSPTLLPSIKIEWDMLLEAGLDFKEQIRKNNHSLFLSIVRPVTFYLSDYQKTFRFSLADGLIESPCDPLDCDVELSSEALHYCFTHLWGWSTLRINGRLQAPKGRNARFKRFVMLGHVAQLNNFGIYMGWNRAFLRFAVNYLREKIRDRYITSNNI
ncbi:MBL fold metallo-hydrolase [Brevibacillus brevis]|uniref:MBL fold metallo-hydrolase n=1 Tax=Brevibacillus brevis TaxID=1393 RepID=UPI001F43614E|nr:MBL fold metallo-hydrolase [Brevibacillus brevis]UIO41945.1 MBL fold metallo-hydrolase [Brevibacillus brevis]